MSITRYRLEDAAGNDQNYEYDEDEYRDARDEARKYGLRVIAYEFEFADSYMVDDFTEGADTDEDEEGDEDDDD